MPNFASILAAPPSDGLLYCKSALLPAAEADLYDPGTAGQPYDPVPMPYHAVCVASVVLSAVNLTANTGSYVVLQTDLGSGDWFDVCWSNWTGTSGSAAFLFYGSIQTAGAFQQTRAVGTAPSPAVGTNAIPLGGRIRFTGKGSYSVNGGSPSPGGNGLFCTIRYRLVGRR
jgi:hypothetical protein